MIRRSIVFILLFIPLISLWAHDIKWVKLDVDVLSKESWKITLKAPLISGKVPPLTVWINDEILMDKSAIQHISSNEVFHERIVNAKDLRHKSLHIKGIDAFNLKAFVQVSKHGETLDMAIIKHDKTPYQINDWSTNRPINLKYFKEGIFHVLGGYDHLLFLMVMTLLIPSVRKLIKIVTAFTIAHGTSLILSSIGLFQLPVLVVEILIALSIFYLALEIVESRSQNIEGDTLRHPWLMAFIFGLLHGMGYANALLDLGLPKHAFWASLISFNVGVEISQILIVLGYTSLLYLLFRYMKGIYHPSRIILAYASGGIASFWVIGRSIQFLF